MDPPSPNLLTVPSPTLASAAVPAGFPGPDGNSGGGGSGGGNGGRSLFLPVGGGYGGGRDHGLRTPPAPPMQQQLQTAIPEDFQVKIWRIYLAEFCCMQLMQVNVYFMNAFRLKFCSIKKFDL